MTKKQLEIALKERDNDVKWFYCKTEEMAGDIFILENKLKELKKEARRQEILAISVILFLGAVVVLQALGKI